LDNLVIVLKLNLGWGDLLNNLLNDILDVFKRNPKLGLEFFQADGIGDLVGMIEYAKFSQRSILIFSKGGCTGNLPICDLHASGSFDSGRAWKI
jgi:hypothetical protein